MAERKVEIRFCEYNKSNPDYDWICRPEGSGDYLFLLLKAPMKVRMGQKSELTRQNACILYTPGVEQNYQAVQKFRNSYMHFSSEENPGKVYGIPLNQVFYPENCDRIDEYIKKLQRERLSKELFFEERLGCLVRELFIELARGLQRRVSSAEQSNLYESFSKLRLRLLQNYEKEWSTRELCQMANMEKSQFYAYYQKFFQSTPHEELIQVRMDKAKYLLSSQAVSIGQVAQMCGYSNSPHFCRSFKKECGCTPGEFRNQKNIL